MVARSFDKRLEGQKDWQCQWESLMAIHKKASIIYIYMKRQDHVLERQNNQSIFYCCHWNVVASYQKISMSNFDFVHTFH